MNLSDIFNRVAKWNSQRYEQEYNHDLAMSLLREEYQEWLDADDATDKLDALCDTIYVAMGVLWKSKLDWTIILEDNEQAFIDTTKLMEANCLMPGYFIGAVIDQCDDSSDYPVSLAMAMIVQLSFTQMLSMGLTQDETLKAMSIVCDSNESKKIEKVSADVKANKDKGPLFVSPEPRLTKLLEKVDERRC